MPFVIDQICSECGNTFKTDKYAQPRATICPECTGRQEAQTTRNPTTPEQEQEMRAVARAMLDLRPDAPIDLVAARLGMFVFKDGRLSDTVSVERRRQIAQAEKLFEEWQCLQARERTEADIDRKTEIGNDLYELGFLLKWEKPVWTLTHVEEMVLTSSGKRLLKHCPSSKGIPIGPRTLIERVHGLGDYAGHIDMIVELIQDGYLKSDTDGKVKRTVQGDDALVEEDTRTKIKLTQQGYRKEN
jgi:hypothetical protein